MLTVYQLITAKYWYEFLHRLCPLMCPKPDDFEKRILAPYSETHRDYHTLTHIDACLTHFRDMSYKIVSNDPAIKIEEREHFLNSIELAIWFHDIVYDPQSSNNEEASANAMKQFCKDFNVNKDTMNEAAHLIICTKSHKEAITVQDKLMNDIDLSILWESPKAFWAYEHGIRKEYSFVPDDVYRVERCKVMKKFADKEKHGTLFQTEMFYDKFNNQARENLRHLIAYLEG